MSRKTKHKSKAHQHQPAAVRRFGWKIAGMIVVAVVLALAGYFMWGTYAASSGPDTSKLLGKWQRPDGGYVLELSSADPGGILKAAYFNPRSIKVSVAQWKFKDGRLQVFVELRDVNYPGSTYTLLYDPAADQLKGIYFQAVEKQNFEVAFVRTNVK